MSLQQFKLCMDTVNEFFYRAKGLNTRSPCLQTSKTVIRCRHISLFGPKIVKGKQPNRKSVEITISKHLNNREPNSKWYSTIRRWYRYEIWLTLALFRCGVCSPSCWRFESESFCSQCPWKYSLSKLIRSN